MRNRTYKHLLFVGCLLAGGALPAATTYYLSAGGDDQNTGTEPRPFHSFNKAMEAARPGDTIIFQPGVYPGGMVIRKSGQTGQPIVIKGYGAGSTRIQGRFVEKREFTPVAGHAGVYELAEADVVRQVAFDLDTTPLIVCPVEELTDSLAAVAARNFRMFYDAGAGKLYVRHDGRNPSDNHTVHLFYEDFAFNASGAHDVIIEEFAISHFVKSGIVLHGSRNVTVRRCAFSLAPISGRGAIDLYDTDDIRIENNRLFRLMTAIHLQETRNTSILRNTVYRTRSHGILLYRAVGATIKNNIVWAGGRSGNALYQKNSERGLSIDYNCYLDDVGPLVCWGATGRGYPTFWDYRAAVDYQDRHSLCADPLFVSTAIGAEDLRLQPRSPCKGKAEDGQDLGADIEW